MPKWKIGNTYKTVGGLDAKLVHKMDEKQARPLIFVITGSNGVQFIAERDEQGRLLKDQIYSLNVVPPGPDKTSKFVNVYFDKAVGGTHLSVAQARKAAGKVALGVLEIQFEDDKYFGTVFHPDNEGEDK